jgi:CRISPR-associated protein Cmr1
LRFWWRALNWCHAAKAHPTDIHAALRHLHAEESRLFGRSAVEQGGEQVGGQGVFVMQVSDQSGAAKDQPFGTGFDNGILYLLGMGLGSFKDGNHCLRGALPAGKGFELRLLFRPGTKPADIASVVDAVKAFGLLGALGSRARHGMGSVALTSLTANGIELNGWTVPTTADTYCRTLTALLKIARSATGEPPLSAFSTESRLHLSMQRTGKDAATKLLADLGREQQAYRSYGKDNRVNDKPSERNFVEDHNLVRNVANGERTVAAAPQRVVFGLPHNYFFSSDKAKVDINYRGDEGRRASPLLLHIHCLGDGSSVAIHTLLRSRFLPEERPSVTMKPGPRNVPVNVNWSVLTNYLDRFDPSSKRASAAANPAWATL